MTTFQIKDHLIKKSGTRVKCTKCRHVFNVFPQPSRNENQAPAVSDRNKQVKVVNIVENRGNAEVEQSYGGVKNERTILPDRSEYIGPLVDGRPHGNGTIIYPEGAKYEGQLVNGKFEGTGTLTLTNGMSYTGRFKAGQRHGQGILTFPDGSVYAGSFVNGEVEGEGVLTSPDGAKYSSRFENGRLVGPGN
jgi:predicted Zn finger-like uncharacterized protein